MKIHGGIQKKAKGMGKEVGSHKAAGYPKAGKHPGPVHGAHREMNSNHASEVGGDIKSVKHYSPKG